jgi:uncharacterized protein YdaU (DUF1376 family)
MKETFYFSHDYNARSDVKIKRLIAKHGLLGYGIYWSIIEDLYQNANALPLDCESIAFDLRTNEEAVQSIINDFDLFIIEGKEFGSLSVQRRLEERVERSKKAQKSAYSRWNKNANALQPQSDSNAIKERKGKENKESKEELREAKPKNKITIWLDKNCPTVQKMKEPITYEQAEKLLNDFPSDKEKAILADTFLAMENHSQLLKKYKSANLTVRNWVKNRFDSEPKNQLGKADKWTHPDQVDITDLDFFSKIPKPPPIEDAEAQHQWSCTWKVQQHRQYISDNNL